MAVQIAGELTREGIDAVPVFWMATEDHDVDEVRHATWFHDGRATRFELPAPADAGKPVGRVALGAASTEAVRDVAASPSPAAPTPQLTAVIEVGFKRSL